MPTFSALASPTIVYGTSTTTLTGTIGSGTAYPTGSSVSITLNSVTQPALVDGSGNFTTTFSTASLGVAGSPYTVTYYFAGNASFSSATDTSTTVTVAPESLTIDAVSDSKTYDGGTSSSQTPTVVGTIYNGEVTYSQAFQSKDVLGTGGSALVVSYTVNPADSADYSISTNSASGTIIPLGLTITAVSDSKTYDGGTSSSQTPTLVLEQAHPGGPGGWEFSKTRNPSAFPGVSKGV